MKVVLFWLIVVFILSVYPLEGGFKIPHADKAVHFIIYAITCILFFTFLIRKMRFLTALTVSVFLSAGYGFLMEVMQTFTVSRSFSIFDQIANTLGALSGAVFITLKRRGR